jgi:hypothetical protein
MKMLTLLLVALLLTTGCVARYELRPLDAVATDAPRPAPTVSRNSTTINVR